MKFGFRLPSISKRIYNQTTFGIEDITRRRRSSSAKFWWLLVFMVLGLVWRVFAASEGSGIAYSVVRITDGDTFVATDGNIQFKVRIAGMDAPEKAQSYGKVAKSALSSMIAGQRVTIKTVGNGMDQYGRVLGIVFVHGEDVAEKLILQGLATYYRPQCQDFPTDKDKYNYDPRLYIQAEMQARSKKLNFWSINSVTLPCEFRRQNRN